MYVCALTSEAHLGREMIITILNMHGNLAQGFIPLMHVSFWPGISGNWTIRGIDRFW